MEQSKIYLLKNIIVKASVHRLTHIGLKKLTEKSRERSFLVISSDKLHWEAIMTWARTVRGEIWGVW